MSELPKGWEELPIGQVILPFKSTDPTKEPSKEFRYIDIGSIDNSCQAITDPKSFKGKDAPSRARRVVQEGDVLFSTVRTYLKNIATVPSELSGALTSTGIAVLRPSARMDSRYLFHWVASDAFITEISKSQDGTMYPAVSDRDVSSSRIAVPPLSERHRIVTKLDSLTGHTARARGELGRIPRLIQKYRERLITSALSGAWTGDGAKGGWTDCKAKELFTWSSGKFLPKSKQANGRIPVYGGNGINGTHDRASVDLPTIVVGRVGAQCGNVYLTGGPAWITDNAIFAQTISERVDPRFALLVLRHSNLNAQSGGTGQPYVNQDNLNDVEFCLPSLREQHSILKRIEAAFAWLDRVATEHANASRLLPKLDQAILAKAFRGELVLSDGQPRKLADAES